MQRLGFLCVLGGFLIFGVAGGAADEVQLGALKDNTLFEDANGRFSNGAGPVFFVGKTGQGLIRRGVLSFDIAAGVPEGATINSADLTLHMSRTNSGPVQIGLLRLLSDWGEGASKTSGGQGAPSQPGDATWIHTFYDDKFWNKPGGDFAADARAVQTVGDVGFYTWNSTAELVADVQGWLDNPPGDFGWLLRGDEDNPQTSKRFDTRENSESDFRPVLKIEFTPVPEPTGAAFAILSGLLLFRRQRRN